MTTPDVYPAIGDWREHLRAQLPHAWNAGQAFAFVECMAREARVLDVMIEDLIRGLVDVEHAAPEVLALMGRAFGQPRDAMPWHEYRRIVAAARIVAVRRSGTFRRSDLWALWLGLTGADESDASITNPSSTVPGVRLVAVVGWQPSRAYLDRAGRILGRALPPAMPYNAVVSLAGALTLDGAPELDGGHLAYVMTEDRAL